MPHTQNKHAPRILKLRTVQRGKWLTLDEIDFIDAHGAHRTWETVRRNGGRGAALVVATLRPSGRLILIRQYRPPVDAYVIEFPAGLVDEGESPASAALRELREETGYTGRIERASQPVYTSPGLTDEWLVTAVATIDEEAAENRSPTSANEPEEDIEVMRVKEAALGDFLRERSDAGDKIDAKVALYLLASRFSS